VFWRFSFPSTSQCHPWKVVLCFSNLPFSHERLGWFDQKIRELLCQLNRDDALAAKERNSKFRSSRCNSTVPNSGFALSVFPSLSILHRSLLESCPVPSRWAPPSITTNRHPLLPAFAAFLTRAWQKTSQKTTRFPLCGSPQYKTNPLPAFQPEEDLYDQRRLLLVCLHGFNGAGIVL
jgi:hypothetical protein